MRKVLRLRKRNIWVAKVVGSIPTAPTNHLPDGWTLTKNTPEQKGDQANDAVLCFLFSGTSDSRIFCSVPRQGKLKGLRVQDICLLP
jgi:hypothetical protein